jgi:hypothetical protein
MGGGGETIVELDNISCFSVVISCWLYRGKDVWVGHRMRMGDRGTEGGGGLLAAAREVILPAHCSRSMIARMLYIACFSQAQPQNWSTGKQTVNFMATSIPPVQFVITSKSASCSFTGGTR